MVVICVNPLFLSSFYSYKYSLTTEFPNKLQCWWRERTSDCKFVDFRVKPHLIKRVTVILYPLFSSLVKSFLLTIFSTQKIMFIAFVYAPVLVLLHVAVISDVHNPSPQHSVIDSYHFCAAGCRNKQTTDTQLLKNIA